MDAPVYLIRFDSAGMETYFRLLRNDDVDTFYLPDSWSLLADISKKRDKDHSIVRLDITKLHGLLSVYAQDPEPVIVLSDDVEIEMPFSTVTHQKSIIVTENHHFMTSSGYWKLKWDFVGLISGFMDMPLSSNVEEMKTDNGDIDELPVLELVTAGQEGALIDREDLENLSDDELRQPALVTEIRLSPILSGGSELAEIPSQMALESQELIPQSGEKGDKIESDSHSLDDSTEDILPVIEGMEATTVAGTAANNMEPAKTTLCMTDSLSMLREAKDPDVPSESSSQLQQDDRRPKRRLSEIEHEDSTSTAKKHKTTGTKFSDQYLIEATPTSSDIVHKTVSETLTLNEKPFTVVRLLDVSAVATCENKDDQISMIKAEQKRPKQVVKTNSTPTRVSSRSKSETPKPVSMHPSAAYDHKRPKVIFGSTSTVPRNKTLMSMIGKLGGTIVNRIDHADVLCIGKGHIKKTSKFIIAVATGKEIVTDDWLQEAHVTQQFPDCQPFLPQDTQHEKEWGFSLSEAVQRGKSKSRLLQGIDVYLTAQLRKDLGNLTRELKQVAKTLGAAHIHHGLPKTNIARDVVVVGSTRNQDPDTAKVRQLGHKLYSQDIVTMAALRGRLELQSDEFLLEQSAK